MSDYVYRPPALQYWLQNRQPKRPPVVHETSGALIAGTGTIAGVADHIGGAVIRAPLVAFGIRRISRTRLAIESQPMPVRQPIIFHDAAGTLTGPGSALAGVANRTHVHTSTGALNGPGADLDGTAAHTGGGGATHTTSGALQAAGSTLAGTANRTHVHTSTGTLTGPGSVLVGTAARFRLHAAASTLTGPGAVLAGVALHGVIAPGTASASDRGLAGAAISDRAAGAVASDRGLGTAGLSER